MSEQKVPMWQRWLNSCPEKDRILYEKMMYAYGPEPDWAEMQLAYLDSIDYYLDTEIAKPVEAHIDSHEAGGQMKVAFAHQMVRPRQEVYDYMEALMKARKEFTDKNYYHGFPDCVEIHHEIETFQFFQAGMVYYDFPGKEIALESILDVAEHVGNWAEGVPDWYDWEKHEFTSVYLGTGAVKDYPPFDYQEANHFRFVSQATLAYLYTKEQKYLDLVCDYCDHWCEHIESAPAEGPITCQILPQKAKKAELGYSGDVDETKSGEEVVYQIFYNTVASNTMYDIVNTLLDAYTITNNERYLAAAEKMNGQCIINSDGLHMADTYSKGKWKLTGAKKPNVPEDEFDRFCIFDGGSSSGMAYPGYAMRYTMLTGDTKYKDLVLAVANALDEENNKWDQGVTGIAMTAHFFDGNSEWLRRMYRQLLIFGAVTESEDHFHLCDGYTRPGSKGPEYYSPMVGDPVISHYGEVARPMFRYESDGKPGLKKRVAMRVWYNNQHEFNFEIKNLNTESFEWKVKMGNGDKVEIVIDDEKRGDCIVVPGNSGLMGIFVF